MSHTQGKLGFDQYGSIKTSRGETLSLDGVSMPCGYVPSEHIGKKNARRLVACWNACDGISTEALEMAAALGGLRDVSPGAAVFSQRDELLAALKDMLSWLDDGNRDISYACLIDVKNARAAIARAEKGGAA
jgi:hypothetical protein